MTAEAIIRHNERTCITFNALKSIFLGNTVMTTYYLSQGLSQTQIFILQTTLCVLSISSDMPFGYLTDRFGTRIIMITGSCIMLAQGVYFAFCREFWEFMIALVGTGLYLASLENTTNGLMMRSLQQLDDPDEAEARYQRYLIKNARVVNAAYALVALVGGTIVWLGGLAMPYRLQPFVWLCVLLVAWQVVDPPARVQEQRADLQMLIKSLRYMLLDNKAIRAVILLYSSFRAYQILCFWVLQPRMSQAGISESAFSLVYFTWSLVISLLTGLLKSMRAESAPWFWVRIILICALGAYLAGATTSLWGFLALMTGLTLIPVLVERLFNEYLERALPEDGVMRNTELSVGSTIPLVAYAIAGPFFGMVIDGTSLSVSLYVLAAVFFVTASCGFLLFQRAVARR